jgi:hypothetical protein
MWMYRIHPEKVSRHLQAARKRILQEEALGVGQIWKQVKILTIDREG